MKDLVCSCIFCLGIGMIAGAVITANNKKALELVTEGSKAVSDSYNDVKENISNMKSVQNLKKSNSESNKDKKS